MIKKRTTVYLDSKLAKMLKIRSATSDESVSEYISKVVYQDLMEEKEDLKDIRKILKEPTISFEKMLEKLNITDEI